MYLQYHVSEKKEQKNKIIFYSLCLLYILLVGTLAIDILAIPIGVVSKSEPIPCFNFALRTLVVTSGPRRLPKLQWFEFKAQYLLAPISSLNLY